MEEYRYYNQAPIVMYNIGGDIPFVFLINKKIRGGDCIKYCTLLRRSQSNICGSTILYIFSKYYRYYLQ